MHEESEEPKVILKKRVCHGNIKFTVKTKVSAV